MRSYSRCLAIFALAVTPVAWAGSPWDVPFSSNTNAVVSAAKAVQAPNDTSLVVLLSDYHYSIDSSGRTTAAIRKVYRILKEDAVADWASVEQSYQPWHEDKPKIQARVIEANGLVHLLDEKTVADAPGQQFDQDIFSDDRLVRAPLPGVGVGAVVEYEITTKDQSPLLDAGVARRILIFDAVPIQRFHAVIEAAKGIALGTATRMIPESALSRVQTKAGTRVECDWSIVAARKEIEPNLPPDVSAYPYLSFSTGASWQAVARRYDGIVDRQIQKPELKTIMEGVDLKGTPLEVAARLTERLHQSVRYTGVEFGEAAIVPGSPAQTVTRKYGDCKDKSALLVAMLREAGLNAHLALLESGYGVDVDRDLPGLGLFDHAIVYVSTNPPLWIDATATDTAVGTLPMADQGRLALVAAPVSDGLVTTPQSASHDNWEHHTIDVRLTNYGPGQVDETIEAGGELNAELRSSYNLTDKQLRDRLEAYVKRNYAGKLGEYRISRHDDFQQPFRWSVQARKALAVTGAGDSASIPVYPYLLFENLPDALTGSSEDDSGVPKKARTSDFLLTKPYQMEYHYRFHLPPLYKLVKAPESEVLKLGTAVYEAKVETRPDGLVEVTFRFDSGKRRLSPQEFQTFKEKIRKYARRTPETLGFISEASQLIALGQTGKAISGMRESVSHHDLDASAHAGYSRTLVTLGLGGPALTEARRAVRLDPKSSEAWQALAWAYEFNSFGERFTGNWNRLQAEAAFRKALALDPGDPVTEADLAILLEHNSAGVRYGPGARLDEAASLFRNVIKEIPSPAFEQNLVIDLFRANHLEEAQEEAKKASADLQVSLSAVVAAIHEGAASAILKIQGEVLEPSQRPPYLGNVAFSLMQLRRYDLALPLLNAAARLSNTAGAEAETERLANLKRWEDALFPTSDARRPVQEYFLLALHNEWDAAHAKELLGSSEDPAKWDSTGFREGFYSAMPAGLSNVLAGEPAVDAAISLLTWGKEGSDESGYRITAGERAHADGAVFYVVLENGKYRLVRNVGALVSALAARGDLKDAQRWLDWAVKDARPEADGTGFPAVRSLWSGILPETRGLPSIEVAAASLEGNYAGSPAAIRTLKAARAKAATELDRSQIDKALCESFNTAKNWDELMVASRRLGMSKVFAEEGFRYRVKAATELRNWQELEVAAQARFKLQPQNITAMRAMALARAYRGDRQGSAEWVKKLEDSPIAGSSERELAAWAAMLSGSASAETVENLKKGDSHGVKDFSIEHYYTLAMLEAVEGAPDDAFQSLHRAIQGQEYTALDARAWVAFARVCQLYGFPREAADALRRARSVPPHDEMSTWALDLASRTDPEGAANTKSSSLSTPN